MGMIGYYFRADDDIVQKLREGSNGILFDEDNEDRLMCVDKAWHAIHYTLTGEVWGMTKEPASWLVLGGEPVNDEDMGYGPARLIEKDIVKLIADALAAWDEAAFRESFSIEDMIADHVYPVMDNESEEEFFQYVWANFAELKKWIQEVAEAEENVIVFMA